MAYPSARTRRVQRVLLNVIDENTDTANTWLPIHLSLLSLKVSTAIYLYLYLYIYLYLQLQLYPTDARYFCVLFLFFIIFFSLSRTIRGASASALTD